MGKRQKIIFYGGAGILGSTCLLPLFAQTKPGLAQVKPSVLQAKPTVMQIKKPLPNKLGRIATKQNGQSSPPPRFQGASGGKAGADMPTKPVDKDDPFVYLWADYGKSEEINKESVVTLLGNVIMYYQESVFKTAKGTYNRDKKIGTAPGRIEMQDKENKLVGNKGFVEYEKTTAEVEGNVKLETLPKSDKMKKDLSGPIVLTCQKMRYNWDSKVAIPSGDIHIFLRAEKKDWIFTCDEATYDGKAEIVKLSGNVKGNAKVDGSSVVAKKDVYVSLKGDGSIQGWGIIYRGPKEEIKKDKSDPTTNNIDITPPPPPTIAEETTPPPPQ
jgi:lipopolysaccharide export system protein LptA